MPLSSKVALLKFFNNGARLDLELVFLYATQVGTLPLLRHLGPVYISEV